MATATEADLKRQQAYNLWWTARPTLDSEAGAVRLLKSAGIAALGVLLEGYLEAAVFAAPRKPASMLRLLMTAAELESFSSRQIEMTKKLWIWRGL